MKIYFVGIAGKGLSSLAIVCKQLGHEVYGSDENYSGNQVPQMINLGIKFYTPYNALNIPSDIDIVIQNASVIEGTNGYKEIERANELNIPVRGRDYLIDQIAKKYNSSGVAGTHGKTTTSSLIAHCLLEMKKDPTFIVGDMIQNINKSANAGKGEYFVWEADEYKNAFLGVHLNNAILNNIEYDHPDFFKTFEDYVNSFKKFAEENISDILIINKDNEITYKIGEELKDQKKVISFGKDKTADFYFSDISYSNHLTEFKIHNKNEKLLIKSKLYGEHNIYNITAAFALLLSLKLDPDKIISAISTFRGSSRRFETIFENDHVKVISDYAHHPTAVKTTINGAKSLGLPIVAIFEPHQYARLKALFSEFCDAFENANQVFVLPIYAAREKDIPKDFVKHFTQNIKNPNKEFLDSYEKLLDLIKKENGDKKLYLYMSASVNTESLDQFMRKNLS